MNNGRKILFDYFSFLFPIEVFWRWFLFFGGFLVWGGICGFGSVRLWDAVVEGRVVTMCQFVLRVWAWGQAFQAQILSGDLGSNVFVLDTGPS